MVSVIIPTYNGAKKLPQIIQAILSQTVTPQEVIIVVDGSTDGTKEVLAEASLPNHFRVIFRKNGGRAAVRNTGADVAKSELLVFFDDDMLPEKNCVETHINHHQTHLKSILTGAQIDRLPSTATDFQKFKAYLAQRWASPLHLLDQPLPKEKPFITAANFSIPRDLFFALGGFDERLCDAEDFDLAVRASMANVDLYYDYNAFAWHLDRVDALGYLKRMRQYRKANASLLQLKPELFENKASELGPTPTGLKCIFFKAFANKFWVKWFATNSAVRNILLPRFIRFKIYDWILTANSVYFPDRVTL